MKNILLLVFVLSTFITFSQQTKSVFVKDKETNEPLAFATIYNYSSNKGVVTNLEGNTVVSFYNGNDEIVISFIGYKKKKITIKNIPHSGVIYLELNSLKIKEVLVVAFQDQDFIAKMLKKVIKINKKWSKTETAKTTLITESIINNVPLERQESIGNSEVSTNSVTNYKIKLGRFGQNKAFNFYTLTATDLAAKFQVLSSQNKSNFPTLITSLSKNKMKKRFNLSYFKNPYGDSSLMKIGFESKSGKEFSGEVLFYNHTKKIKQVTFWIKKPDQQIFYPAVENHTVNLEHLTAKLNFSDNQNRLNYVLMEYKLDYQTPEHHSIESSTLITFEDYKNKYLNPYYTGKLDFDGEYFQILFNSFDDRFWKENFNYSQSERVNKTYNFFKENGYVANFNKYSSDSLFQFLDIRIKNWATTRLEMKELNFNSSDFGIRENIELGDEIKYTISDMYNFKVNYYSNKFEYKDKTSSFVIHPKIDLHNSYYFLNNDWKTEVALNIFFDLYKINAKKVSVTSMLEDASKISSQFLNNSKRGENLDSLVLWNEKIHKGLNIDNVEFFIKKPRHPKYKPTNLPDYYNIGLAYFHLEKYETALYFFNEEQSIIEAKNRFFELTRRGINDDFFTEKETKEVINLLFNRAQTYIKLNQAEKACADLKLAFELGDKESEIKYKVNCK